MLSSVFNGLDFRYTYILCTLGLLLFTGTNFSGF